MAFVTKLGSRFLDESGKFTKGSIKDAGVKTYETEEEALAAGIAAGFKEQHLAVFEMKSSERK